jgi:hypothetical protein
VWRTDVDFNEDVPVLGPETEGNTDGRSMAYARSGPKLYRVEGELWREEWIEPSTRSERVRGDDPIDISFVIDAAGNREPSSSLYREDIGRYLWFDPRVITAQSSRRGGGLHFYTRDTGEVWLLPSLKTHFGLNALGLINVYAFDIARLPGWQQRIWAGYNVSPQGGVSTELLDAQMRATPARTAAPEAELHGAFDELDQTVKEWLGSPLFLKHGAVASIFQAVHRFRVLEPGGLLALAKDLARLTADRIDVNTLRRAASPPPGEKWGSIKSLEKAVGTLVGPAEARTLLSPFVAIYEMRLGDAHLPSKEIAKAFELARVDPNSPQIEQGRVLLAVLVEAMKKLRDTIKNNCSPIEKPGA